MKIIKLTTLSFLVLLLLNASRPSAYNVGDEVSNFTLKNVNGKMVSLSDYKKSKGVIVIFDCNTCPFSQQYNDRIISLNKKYASEGFPVIAINPNDSKLSPGDSYDEMVKLAKKKSYQFPYLIDETQEVAKTFGATNTPHVYILKNEGDSFRIVYIGAIDNNVKNPKAADKKYVEDAVDALLADKPVPTDKTKAIGCSVKYRNS